MVDPVPKYSLGSYDLHMNNGMYFQFVIGKFIVL